MDLAQELNRIQLHAAFPKLDVDTVNDVYNECGANASVARARLLSVFGSTGTVATFTPVQSPTSGQDRVPWSPVTAPGQNSIQNEFTTGKLPNSVAGYQKSPEKPGRLINCVASVGSPNTPQGQNRILKSLPKKLGTPVQVGTSVRSPPNAELTATLLNELMPPAPQPAPAPASGSNVQKRPVKKPLPRPVPLDVEPQTPQPAKTPLPPHLEYLLSPPNVPAASSPGSLTFEQGGWEESAGDSQVVPESSCQPPQMSTASPLAGAPAPAVELDGKSDGRPESQSSKLEFLQGVFSSMDPALVADVMQGVENDAEAAMDKLMALQVTPALVNVFAYMHLSSGNRLVVCSHGRITCITLRVHVCRRDQRGM